MEFYYDLDAYSGSDYASFNSQRDGILPKLGGGSTRASGVSIPNGMEFYVASFQLISKSLKVSIPNGMEFYALCRRIDRSLYVSIPNGMEFYPRVDNTDKATEGFNSQRDGILPIATA